MANKNPTKAQLEEIEGLLKKAKGLIQKAEALGDLYGASFSWDFSYGMGGTYYPKGWQESEGCSFSNYEERGDWLSSSEMC